MTKSQKQFNGERLAISENGARAILNLKAKENELWSKPPYLIKINHRFKCKIIKVLVDRGKSSRPKAWWRVLRRDTKSTIH